MDGHLRPGAYLFAVPRQEDGAFAGYIGLGGRLERMGARSLEAETFPDNLASARVLEKAGFVSAGLVERDLPLRGGLRTLRLHRLEV